MHAARDEACSEPAGALHGRPAEEAHARSAMMQEPGSLLLRAVLALAESLRRDEAGTQAQECLQELLPTLTSFCVALRHAEHMVCVRDFCRAGPLHLALLPAAQSLAGLAAAEGRQLRTHHPSRRSRLLDVGDQLRGGHRHVTVATPLLGSAHGSAEVLGAVVAYLDIDTCAGDRALPYLRADLRTLAHHLGPRIRGYVPGLFARLAEFSILDSRAFAAVCQCPAQDGADRQALQGCQNWPRSAGGGEDDDARAWEAPALVGAALEAPLELPGLTAGSAPASAHPGAAPPHRAALRAAGAGSRAPLAQASTAHEAEWRPPGSSSSEPDQARAAHALEGAAADAPVQAHAPARATSADAHCNGRRPCAGDGFGDGRAAAQEGGCCEGREAAGCGPGQKEPGRASGGHPVQAQAEAGGPGGGQGCARGGVARGGDPEQAQAEGGRSGGGRHCARGGLARRGQGRAAGQRRPRCREQHGRRRGHGRRGAARGEKGRVCARRADTRQHPLWLSFAGRDLERAFRVWHCQQLSKADAMCCTLAIAIFAYLGFAQPHALASHAPLAYALTMCAMLALLAAAWVVPRICSPQALWYRGLRTCVAKGFVALYLAFNSQVSFPRVLRAMAAGGGNASPCSLPFVLRYINAQPLLTTALTTMVPMQIQAPMQAVNLLLSAGLPARTCAACYAAPAQLPCVLRMHALQLLGGFVVPVAITFLVELRFRVIYLRGHVTVAG